MWPVSASASGFAGDEGTPRNGGRGGRADAGRGGRADAGRGGRPAAGGNPGRGGHCARDLSQEEILDLVVEAMLAAGGPAGEDDDLGDDDGVDADSLAGSLWGTRDWDTGAAAGPPGTGGQDCGPAGFGSGQPLDVARPGPALAGAADRVHTGALRRVSDEELTGMIRAWRRLSSWATARELGAIAEFARRRPDEDPGPGTDGDVARRARARRAASGPPGAAKQAGSAQGSAQAAQPGGANPAAQAAQPGGANPAAQGAPAGGTAGATSAVQGAPAASAGRVNPAAQGAPADGTAGATSAARGAPAAPAGGAGGATPAAQAPAAAPAAPAG